MTKRNPISNQQKLQIIVKAAQECSWAQTYLAHWATKELNLKHTSIDRSTVGKILKRADTIKSLGGRHLKQYKTQCAFSPQLESDLVSRVDRASSREISVTRALIQDEAQAISGCIALPDDQFKFSNGWMWGFQKRFGIKSRLDCGEAGSCSLQEVVTGRLDCQDVAFQYEMQSVYNLDETAPNYCSHSKRSHGGKGVTKARKLNKQRVTAMLATNVDGSDKLPLYFVGTAKRPQCFKGKTASRYGLTYDANQKGRMRVGLFGDWLKAMDDRFRAQNRHVLFTMDNVSSHKTDKLKLMDIRVHKLAPNTTPFNQPLDAGIGSSFKVHFRRRRDRDAVKHVDTDEKHPCKVDVLTAMVWAVEPWGEVAA